MERFIFSRKKDVDPNFREASAKTAADLDPNVKDQWDKHRTDIFEFCESILIAMSSGKLRPFIAVARDGKTRSRTVFTGSGFAVGRHSLINGFRELVVL